MAPRLWAIAERLGDYDDLVAAIRRAISDDAEVRPDASEELERLFRELRRTEEQLRSRLEVILRREQQRGVVQDPVVVQRAGRWCLAVQSGHQSRFAGILHDRSDSGMTVFMEPAETVEMGNRVREIEIGLRQEIERILAELTGHVRANAEELRRDLGVAAVLDMITAKARLAQNMGANMPSLRTDGYVELRRARHPLLTQDAVPNDIWIGRDFTTLIITGPNTGGKTVALKTVGLLTLMAQCGMHLPVAPGSRLTVFEDVFADIGDEQSIEQSLSTFSSHMKQIIEILDVANERTLVILDELGAGTDPAEGSALARALLDDLVERGITTLVTTHHPELKIYSHEKKGVRNASVEFDLETLRPTYRLIVGLPGRSNALAIAERLGLPKSIVEKARSLVTEEDLIADDLLDEIHKTREETRRAHDEALRAQAHAEEIRNSLRERLEAIEQERREVLAQSRQEAAAELEELRTEIRRIRKQLAAAGQPLEAIRRVTDEVKSLEGEISEMPAPAVEMPEDVDDTRTLRLGDIVWVQSLGVEGQILELGEEDAEVQVGRLRLRAKLDDLAYRSKSESKRDKKKRTARADGGSGTATSAPRAPSPGLELDLRGQTVEDSIPLLEDYLDAAYMAGLPFVRIIHGKGTGVLRQAVRERLNGHPLVKKYARGDEKEGGDGVTVVSLVPSS